MSLLTTTQIRDHVETDMVDSALQRLIDDAEAEIVARYGAHADAGEVSERFTPGPSDLYVWTSRPIDTAEDVTITERYDSWTGETPITLVEDEDFLVEGGKQIRRKIGGDYPRTFWASLVEVAYTPTDADTARRKGVLIDMVKLATRYEGAGSSSLGDVSVSHVDYARERERLLGRLGSFSGSFA